MDVQLSEDGVLVVTHDDTLDKSITKEASGKWLTNSIPIIELTVNQLQHYNVGQIKPGRSYSKRFPFQQPQNFANIPTLKEVINF